MQSTTAVTINIADITIDSGFQMRVALNQDIVNEYAETINSSESDWPFKEPCQVYRVAGELILVDGFHRVAAMKKSDKDQVFVEIHDGSASDALRAAFSANGSHGLRLTNADKRNKVTIALSEPEFAKLSDRKVAELCGVGDQLVSSVRAELRDSCGSAPEDRTGADGVERPASAESAADQRKRIKAAIKEHPEWSNRKIAELIGCSDKTVAGVRKAIAATPDATAPSPVLTTTVHWALANFPQLEAEQYQCLVDDVRRYGQRLPIVVDDAGIILDGRSRLRVCNQLSITPKVEVFKGSDSDKIALIKSLNLYRLQLDLTQYAMFRAAIE